MTTFEPAAETVSGDIQAQFFALAYDELCRIARRQRRRAGGLATLNTTALAHEAWIKLAAAQPGLSGAHGRALAARAMRQILVDHARRHGCAKRGGEACFVTLDEHDVAASGEMVDMLILNETLTELAQWDARAADVAEWHVFGGLAIKEIAVLRNVAVRTAYRDWRRARAFLAQRLGLADAAVATPA